MLSSGPRKTIRGASYGWRSVGFLDASWLMHTLGTAPSRRFHSLDVSSKRGIQERAARRLV
jgi:hypothetical protein